MNTVGVRELKAKASEIVEGVRARRERYQVTRRGRPVALIMPVPEAVAEIEPETLEHDLAVWAEMDALAEDIGRKWPAGVGAVDSLANGRR